MQRRNDNRRKPGFVGTRDQTQCRFCRRGIKYVDYKDIGTLQKLLTNRGKIYSRKRSGNCAKLKELLNAPGIWHYCRSPLDC